MGYLFGDTETQMINLISPRSEILSTKPWALQPSEDLLWTREMEG